jgi:hypothetical protein
MEIFLVIATATVLSAGAGYWLGQMEAFAWAHRLEACLAQLQRATAQLRAAVAAGRSSDLL